MCKCRPNIRTPFCGKPGCEWPEQKPQPKPDDACRWCGFTHGPQCPVVKSIEFYEDGVTVKRLEYRAASDRLLGPVTYYGVPMFPPSIEDEKIDTGAGRYIGLKQE